MPFQRTVEQHIFRKINKRKEEIKEYCISNRTPITDITFYETTEFLTYEEGVKAKGYRPIKVGETWGGSTNGWFKMSIRIPKDWKGKEVAAYIDIGGEACLFLDGKPFQGLDVYHNEVLLAKKAKGGETFNFVLDAASIIWRRPTLKQPQTFSRAEIATRNPDVIEYWFNLEFLYLLAEQLPDESPRKAKIIYALNKSVDAFDYDNTDEDTLRQSALRANEILKPVLQCKAADSATNVAVHGHSHIDVAWLWPYRETLRKCSRTFSTVMRLMEEYPEYIFTQSQAQLYEFTKQRWPSLYEEIKKRAKEGRWDVCGSMWVEADCNLASGESLIRQILIGKNYFMDEFGIETDVLWLPDVFGYAAALPQILKKARVNYFSTIKINWSQFNHFPYTTFYWKGIDGTKVLSHFPPTTDYNAFTEPRKLLQQVNEFVEKDRSDWSLLSYGWGDGGGGPERRHLEFLRRAADIEGLPRCKQMRVSDFFHTIDVPNDYPEWSGELYLEFHRGTYTTQARNKRFNRKSELLYRDAEIIGSIAMASGYKYPYDDLLREWKRILLNQFHDVLPGSSIRLVYEDTDRMYPEILAFGEKTRSDALASIIKSVDTSGEGDAIVLFNTLSWERTEPVELRLPGKGDYSVLDPTGSEIPSQIEDGRITFIATVPAVGYSTYRLVKRAPTKFQSGLKSSKNCLENEFYKIEFDESGAIKSLVEKSSGREVFKEGELGNLLQLFEDKPVDPDAWDIDFFYEDKYVNVTELESAKDVASGPVYAAIEQVRKFGKSKIKQRIVLYSAYPRIDFQTHEDWHENCKCLKASFPFDVNANKARYEIQFGNIERPTHRNTLWDFAKFEVCAHKWADVSEEGFGISLLNDCKYGHSAKGSLMRLTLLRAPTKPDPQADRGEHDFTYSLLPHTGSYIQAETVRRSYELNVPINAVLAKPSKGVLPPAGSYLSVDAPNVVLETMKRAERDESIILRFYECHNQRAKAKIKVNLAVAKLTECDLMEDDIAEIGFQNGEFCAEFRPFEIKTFKLRLK